LLLSHLTRWSVGRDAVEAFTLEELFSGFGEEERMSGEGRGRGRGEGQDVERRSSKRKKFNALHDS
jgi:hypothetical protein